jgi:putative inorganic carbon (hco3(-)) transporter
MSIILLLIYLNNLYIRPQDWVRGLYGLPVDYFTIIPALAYGFFLQAHENKRLVRLPQYGFLAVLLIVIFLSDAVHNNVGLGLIEFVKFFKLVCVFTMILLLVNSTTKLKWTMSIMVLFSAFIGYQAIAQFLSGGTGFAGQDFYNIGVDDVVNRTAWVGLWNGSNITALLLNLTIPFALEFAFGPYRKSWKILNFIFAACLVGGVYTTNSRGGFIALLAILFLYPLFRIRKKKTAIIAGILLAGAIFLYLAPSRAGLINSEEESAHYRTRLWSNGIEMFKDYPLLGVGKGKFKENTSLGLIAHSNFIQNLGEIGGIGIFVWVSILYFSFKGLWHCYSIKPGNNKGEIHLKSLSRALVVSFLGFNICTLFITMEIDLFYLLMGLCAAAANICNREIGPVRVRFTLKDFLAICGIIFGLLLFYHMYTR